MSKDMLEKFSLSSRAVSVAMNDLIKLDCLFQDESGQLEIVNPIIKAVLLENYKNYF